MKRKSSHRKHNRARERRMTTPLGSLCTGYGGLDEAVARVFAVDCLAWWSDVDAGAIAVNERHHGDVRNIGDVTTVDWGAVEPVAILSAGYPCQPFSQAGKRRGTQDSRHLWPHIARGIGVLRPRFVVLENVRGHLRRGLDVVVGDLARFGYDSVWTVVRASDVGAPHRRERVFVLAADAARERDQRGWDVRPRRRSESPDRRRGVGNNAASDRWHEGRPEPTWQQWGSHDAIGGGVVADAVRGGCGRNAGHPEWPAFDGAAADGNRASGWGKYATAVRRWELIMNQEVPQPTITGTRGARVLNPQVTEWMMGIPAGLVTDTPGLTRNQKLRLTGNGVVARQAEFALWTLLDMGRRWWS